MDKTKHMVKKRLTPLDDWKNTVWYKLGVCGKKYRLY